ncbi:hypothetical protein JCM30471_22700 [Desulfuromonas carbonis]|uniref:hypothetical protein n=1 Tax=Desulfuromonas sp. DDH964 TaxID=1823759 RepID=UPI00078D5AF5|nr:hypothetical protein [Desulfuromonas sp. DDH964]AMV73849.1 hypothetical protein DBW_3551 [Desulfuromonas sp. DDH964]
MLLRSLALLLLTLTLVACVPSAPQAPLPERPDLDSLRLSFGQLPGAVLSTTEPLVVSYPGEILFSAGAVLPLAGGTELLDPLAAQLAAYPQLYFSARVRAAAEPAAYAVQLATARTELLTRYFRRRGLDASRLQLTPEVGDGPPLELTLRYEPASSPTSAAEKR